MSNEILPSGYNIYRKDRHSRGGGVLFAIEHSVPSRVLSTPDNIEVVTIEIRCPHKIISVVYSPPNASDVYLNSLINYLKDLLSDVEAKVIILGDFNLPDINWLTLSANSDFANTFCEFVYDNGLSQLISDPTHNRGNILDLLLTNCPNLISNTEVKIDFELCTDHFPILFSLEVPTLTNHPPHECQREVYNYSKIDTLGVYDYLSEYDFSSSLACIIKY